MRGSLNKSIIKGSFLFKPDGDTAYNFFFIFIPSSKSIFPVPSNTKLSKWLYIIIVVIFSASSVGLWYLRQTKLKPVMEAFREGNVMYATHVGKQGARTEMKLPDGAAVILNGHTTLLVPDNFEQTHTVILDGEAYFNTPQALKVVTNILTVTTDSAAFRIRCFEQQQGATAYLGTGKVVVNKSYHSSTDNNAEVLEHGNMVLANKEIDLMEKETYKPEELAVWLKGRLVLEGMPVMNAVRVLEDWYGTEIYVDGDVSKVKPVSGVYENKTLEQVLETLPVTYKMKGDRVNIKVK